MTFEKYKKIWDEQDKTSSYFEYNCCEQWVTEQEEVTAFCWIKPNGMVIPVDWTKHAQVLFYLIYTGQVSDITDEDDAENKGWVKKTYSGWEVGKFPVSHKVKEFIWDEFTNDSYISINNNKFYSQFSDYAYVYGAESLEKYLETGYIE